MGKMVRGRRVRAVVTCHRNDDCCSPNPKRKDQKLHLNGKLTHTVLTSNKTHTITEFFQAVEIDDSKHMFDEALLTNIKSVNGVEKKNSRIKVIGNNIFQNDEAAEINTEPDIPTTPVIIRTKQLENVLSPPTPHRIELCADNITEDVQKNLIKNKPVLPVLSRTKKRLINNQEIIKQEIKCPEKDNHKLTEYFPVRRSVRKTKKTVLEEKQRSLEQILRKGHEDGLDIRNFEGKGRGVVATRTFHKGDFVVEYSGDLIDIVEAKRREEKYAQDQNAGCYMYYFKHVGQQYCIDATAESGKLGRLVNHSRNGNLITRTIMVDNKPRLVLIAKDEINVGEEVLYDYGDRSKESLMHHPWLAY